MIDIKRYIASMNDEQFEDFRLMFHKEVRETELLIEKECEKRKVATINWRPTNDNG